MNEIWPVIEICQTPLGEKFTSTRAHACVCVCVFIEWISLLNRNFDVFNLLRSDRSRNVGFRKARVPSRVFLERGESSNDVRGGGVSLLKINAAIIVTARNHTSLLRNYTDWSWARVNYKTLSLSLSFSLCRGGKFSPSSFLELRRTFSDIAPVYFQ